MSDSVRPHRRQPTRLPRPWDSPGKNTGVGCHFLLQCMKVKMKVKSLSHVRLLATPWTAGHHTPPSMGFSRQEYYLWLIHVAPWQKATKFCKAIIFQKNKSTEDVFKKQSLSLGRKSHFITLIFFLMISVLLKKDLFIYFWLYEVFVAACGLSLAAGSGGYSLAAVSRLRIAVASLVAHRLSCHVACGVFPKQRLNLCPPHWQADSQPLGHQGSPSHWF